MMYSVKFSIFGLLFEGVSVMIYSVKFHFWTPV